VIEKASYCGWLMNFLHWIIAKTVDRYYFRQREQRHHKSD